MTGQPRPGSPRPSAPAPRLRPELDRLTAFRAGAAPAQAAAYQLSNNETPYPPTPAVLAAIAEAAARVNRYPDLAAARLTAEISRVNAVPEDRIALGAGSGALLQTLFQAVAEPGAEALFAWRSFEIYPLFAELAGVRDVRVPLLDEVHDVSAMIERISERTRLVIVCQPNNPTGTALSEAEVERLLAHVPSNCLVALDEAYFEYVRDPRAADGFRLQRRWPNLVALRTFSKAYGLAGLRVGYLAGDPSVVGRLRKLCPPFSISSLAQAAAVAALGVRDQLTERVERIVAERGRVREALLAQGWRVPPSEANFLWIGLGAATDAFVRRCAERQIAVRGFSGEGVRVSLGTPADNDAFLTACQDWLRESGDPTGHGRAAPVQEETT